MTQLSLESLQKRHKELLKLNESAQIGEADITQVDAFLKQLAAAGAYIEDPDQRSLLRAYIHYWASFIDDKTGSFPSFQLEPLPIVRSQADEGTTHVNDQDSTRAKRFGRTSLILIVPIVAIIIAVIAILVLYAINPRQPVQPNCSPTSTSTSQPSSSPISTATSSASPVLWIGTTPFPKNKTFATAPNEWTVIQGDVSYLDPLGSQKFVSVKNAVDHTGNDPCVASLLAVQGMSTIQAPNGGSLDLYQANATHTQIGQILMQHEQNLLHSGCIADKGCKVVSTVIICKGKVVYSNQFISLTILESLQKC